MSASTPALPLSGIVISYNEADRIARCLNSLLPVCQEIVVVDSGSTDGTVEIAAALGARVIHQPWLGFGGQRNFAIAQAALPWVLHVDADEWLEAEGHSALRALFASGEPEQVDVYTLRRRTHFLATAMNFGSFAREPVRRLFRAHIRHIELGVHEYIDTHGQRERASRVRMEHTPARDADEYWGKLQRYAELWAQDRAGSGKRALPGRGGVAAAVYLLKNLVVRAGLLDGPQAWRFHILHARYTALKYRKLSAARASDRSTHP